MRDKSPIEESEERCRALAESLASEQRASRAQRELLERIMESFHSAIFVLDAKTTEIRECNTGASVIFGYSREEMIGRSSDFLHVSPESLEEFRHNLRRGIAEKGMLDWFEFRMRRKDGSLFVSEHSVALLKDAGGQHTGWLSIVRDIDEKKRTEETLRRTEEHLLQSQKMEAVGRLAGGVAHDFNNLLSVIIGNVEMLISGPGSREDAQDDLQEVLTAATRAAALTQQLLAFGRKQILQPRVISVNGRLASFEHMLRRLIGENMRVVIRLDPQDGRVRADPVQLEQVLMNLAVNARDAMPDGGTIVIETECVILGKEYCAEHPEALPGRHVMVAVTDTGHGMTESVKGHLFEPFFTTKDPGKGSGLGLSTSYGIMRQSGGFITVSSEPGLGTTFKIYFPRVDDQADREAARAVGDAVGGTETILFAEDEPQIRKLVSRTLRAHGYAVLEAEDAQSALRAAARHAGPIHLLITDVVMPEMSGEDLARRVSERCPQVRILFISGYAEGVIMSGADFLQKPFSPQTLVTKARQILDRNTKA